MLYEPNMKNNGDGTYSMIMEAVKEEHADKQYSTEQRCGALVPRLETYQAAFYDLNRWETGLITSFYPEEIDFNMAEKSIKSEKIDCTPSVEREKSDDSERERDEIGINERCIHLLTLLIGFIKRDIIHCAADKKEFMKHSDTVHGFWSPTCVFLKPEGTFSDMESIIKLINEKATLPTITEFEVFLFRNGILKAEEGVELRYRKKVQIGNKRPRMWVLEKEKML